jgi:hypothetical protein
MTHLTMDDYNPVKIDGYDPVNFGNGHGDEISTERTIEGADI